jgi:hypothetical protein
MSLHVAHQREPLYCTGKMSVPTRTSHKLRGLTFDIAALLCPQAVLCGQARGRLESAGSARVPHSGISYRLPSHGTVQYWGAHLFGKELSSLYRTDAHPSNVWCHIGMLLQCNTVLRQKLSADAFSMQHPAFLNREGMGDAWDSEVLIAVVCLVCSQWHWRAAAGERGREVCWRRRH